MPIQSLSKSLFLKTILAMALTLYPFDKTLNLADVQNTNSCSNILYFPTINSSREWQTTVSITNAECKCNQRRVKVTLTAYDKDGLSLGVVKNVTRLRGNKTKTINAQTLPSGAESLKVESDGSLIANAIFKTKDDIKSEVIPAIKEPSRQLDFPALASYNDLYIYETITLLNPNTAPTSVDIIALDKDGYEIDHDTLSPLSSMESRDITLVDIFNGSTLKNLCTVRVISDSDIVGFQIVDYPGVDLVGLPALTTTSKVWTFPIVTQGENLELWTKVGILNPGNDTAYFTFEALDSNNNSLGIVYNQKLSAGATYSLSTLNTNIADGVIPLNTAFLKGASDQPVSGYELIGVVNGKGITAVLGIPEEDHDTVGVEVTGSNDEDVLNAYPMVRMRDGSVKSTNGSFGDIKVAKRLLIAKDEKNVSITSKSPFPGDKITSSFAADYSGPAPAAGDEASGIAWAKARKEWLLKRMETDPQAVIDEAFSKVELMRMPEYMHPYLEKRKTVKGTLEIMIMDNFEERISKTLYYLKTREGERYALHFTGKLPHLRSGLRIRIRNGVILDKHIVVPASADWKKYSPKFNSPQPVTGQKKVAVILFNFRDDSSEPFTKEEIRKKVYDDANDYYKEISFNKLSISGYKSFNGEQDIYGWYTIPYNSAPDCETGDWASAANNMATENSNFNGNNYSNIMYVFPKNYNCVFAGAAGVGNLISHNTETYSTWINGTKNLYAITHELGHNFGALHASSYTCHDENNNTVAISNDCDYSEYGDPFDVMGTGISSTSSPYHMSSFYKAQLGWLDAQNIQNVEKDGTFTLVPIEKKSSGIQAIKIPRGTYSESAYYDDYYFLEFRQRYGYDTFDQEGDAVVNGISIRLVKSYALVENESTFLIDTTPGENNNYDEFTGASLRAGKTFKDAIANIEIKTISVSDESAEVEIKTSYVKKCFRQNPSISIYPSHQEKRAGETAQYTLTLTNNDDSATCENSTFNIISTLPAGLSQSPSSFQKTIKPGETQKQTIAIATSATASGYYEFMETAVNESAEEYRQSATAKLNITVNIPETPANFKAEAGECGSQSITLTWSDVENESYYEINRTGSDGEKTITVSQNTTSYIDKNINERWTYYYELKACNNRGCSNTVTVGPIAAPLECQIFKTLTIERKDGGFGKITITNKSDNNQKTVCDLSSKNNSKCEYQYPENSKLKLQAQALSGSVFKKWIGGCSRTSKTCNITLTSDTTVMAEFAAKNKK